MRQDYLDTKVNNYKVCKNGTHWEVYKTQEIVDAYSDTKNLRPMCMSRNSSKSGPKDRDRLQSTRIRKSVCFGPLCILPKAE